MTHGSRHVQEVSCSFLCEANVEHTCCSFGLCAAFVKCRHAVSCRTMSGPVMCYRLRLLTFLLSIRVTNFLRMTRRNSAVRAEAIRRARQVKQERDAAARRRELAVESALADFFEQTALAEALRTQAEAKVARILDDMREAIMEPQAKTRAALRTLAELRETRTSISALTGLSAAEVRAALDDAAVRTPVASERAVVGGV